MEDDNDPQNHLEFEDEFIGEEIQDIPSVDPGEYCNGQKKMKEDGEVVRSDEDRPLFGGYCNNPAGKGVDGDGNGRCKFHAGQAAVANKANQHAQKHALNADPANFKDNLSPEDKEYYEGVVATILDRQRQYGSRDPDFLDRVLANRLAQRMHIVAKASEYTQDELVQVLVHDSGAAEEKTGALVEEVRRYDNSIVQDLNKLLPDEDSTSGPMEQWKAFVSTPDEDEAIVVESTEE